MEGAGGTGFAGIRIHAEEEADTAPIGSAISTGNSPLPLLLRSLARPEERSIQRQVPAAPSTTVPAQPAAQPVEQAEWDAHPAIKKHYETWQAYKIARTKVASWTSPQVADPASYIEEAIGEWNANGAIHADFDHNFDGNPSRSYLNLRRLYQERGIANPANYLATNITAVTFYNRGTRAHRDLQAKLNAAETAMTGAGHTFHLDAQTWSFVPRTFNDNINKLSNHALGKAIDINPKSNPHIKSAGDIRVIDAVCGTILPGGLRATQDFDKLKQASDFFQQNFNHAWIAEQEHLLQTMQSQKPHPPGLAAQKALVTAIHTRHQHLSAYAADGFLSLPKDLVEGLKNAGLAWGGEWHTSKDFMHFELQNP